jgi:hypothetical protein
VDAEPPLGPTGIWTFLAPERDAGGRWSISCPTGCGGLAPIEPVPDSHPILPDYALAGPCSEGCPPEAMAQRLAAETGQPAGDFLPPIAFTPELVDRLSAIVQTDPKVAAAWRNTDNFKSFTSRRAALAHRLREAGASANVIVLADKMLIKRATEP